MSAGVILAAAALAQAADVSAAAPPPAQPTPAYGPATPAPPKTAASAATPSKDCSPSAADVESGAIVVCVVKPDGYRIDPDILAAKKAKRKADTGGPRPPERYADTSCASVGPFGCTGTPAINLLAAAMTAVQITDRLSKGQEIGSIFKTEPEGSSEYQYYQRAKHEREQKQAEADAKAYVAQMQAEAAEKAEGDKE